MIYWEALLAASLLTGLAVAFVLLALIFVSPQIFRERNNWLPQTQDLGGMRRLRAIDAERFAAWLLVKLLGLCLVMFVASYIALWGSERDSVGSAGDMNYARDTRPSPSAPAS